MASRVKCAQVQVTRESSSAFLLRVLYPLNGGGEAARSYAVFAVVNDCLLTLSSARIYYDLLDQNEVRVRHNLTKRSSLSFLFLSPSAQRLRSMPHAIALN